MSRAQRTGAATRLLTSLKLLPVFLVAELVNASVGHQKTPFWLSPVPSPMPSVRRCPLAWLFRAIDLDGDGELSVKERRRFVAIRFADEEVPPSTPFDHLVTDDLTAPRSAEQQGYVDRIDAVTEVLGCSGRDGQGVPCDWSRFETVFASMRCRGDDIGIGIAPEVQAEVPAAEQVHLVKTNIDSIRCACFSV